MGGLEPPTTRLTVGRSAVELHANKPGYQESNPAKRFWRPLRAQRLSEKPWDHDKRWSARETASPVEQERQVEGEGTPSLNRSTGTIMEPRGSDTSWLRRWRSPHRPR